ncbi:paraquat-inducible protein A [Plasticicumulans acidivorans]|uniref:Paraquat-inducible protein A n=1 Tax=Plasticicumulans acidivorans TaxID=886464 RepID=A0A317MUH5_9GAMM|nr:paraquat-inducible protein A [Plasticicumulans acidivorans]PWV61602.1 paraquat-inducible protein A [Plasticicumulans acidivorans]
MNARAPETAVMTARRAGLAACRACHHLAPQPAAGTPARCPRCGAALHSRMPDSLAQTWALLLSAWLLIIPANALPVMSVIMFGRGQPDTILSGVVELLHAGQWPLAALVFFASILIPGAKLLALTWLLIAVQRRSIRNLRARTLMYRIVEAVGRWSMIDVFMVSILAALVRLQALATIEPGPGAVCFAAVVVLTMFAALRFDPRLLWDALDGDD